MSWLMASVYDLIMSAPEEACLGEWRRQLLSSAQGRVVEIGAGTGVNLEHYPEAVTALILAEPDPHMRRRLMERVERDPRSVEVIDAPSEALPLADASVDTVVATLVCCTVPDPAATLAEVRRILRPGGQLLFLEHVAAEDNPGRLAWQRRIEPVWRWVAGGCHLTRPTANLIAAAGLDVEDLTRESMRRSLPFVRPTIRGRAVKPGEA